ncbi:MAG: FxsA family protein [Fibrobacterota bacterium]
MLMKLLLLFIGIPLIELYTLLALGSQFGVMPTLTAIILTGFLGAFLARLQGLSLFVQIQNDLRLGNIPAVKMIDGAILFAAGIILLIPGLFTDVVGLILLTPPGRKALRSYLSKVLSQYRGNRNFTYNTIFTEPVINDRSPDN